VVVVVVVVVGWALDAAKKNKRERATRTSQ
jgi:hypothetical protein